MIHDVDGTLQRLLLGEMGKIPGNPIRDHAHVTFDPPAVAEETQDRAARLNLYLHDIRENREMRDEGYTTFLTGGDKNGAGRRPPPVRLDLSYLVTVYAGDDPMTEHRLLGDALGVLLRFLALPGEYLTGALSGLGSNSVLLRVAQPDLIESNDPTSLWQALGGRLRPAISLVVTTPFDAYETIWTKRVRSAVFGIGQGVPPNGPQRPLELTPIWVSIAGMVVDQVTERPLAGVSVEVGGTGKTLLTNDEGVFYLLNMPPGPYALRCRRRGYASDEQTMVAPPSGRPEMLEPAVFALRPLDDAGRAAEAVALAAEAAVHAAGKSSTVLEVSRTHTVSGVLRYADGRPASFVPVRIGHQTTATDAAGAYVFVNIPPGDHPLVVEAPGQEPKEVIQQGASAIMPAEPTASAAGRA
jgi:hypothetical protein